MKTVFNRISINQLIDKGQLRGKGTVDDPLIVDSKSEFGDFLHFERIDLHMIVRELTLDKLEFINVNNIIVRNCTVSKLIMRECKNVVLESNHVQLLEIHTLESKLVIKNPLFIDELELFAPYLLFWPKSLRKNLSIRKLTHLNCNSLDSLDFLVDMESLQELRILSGKFTSLPDNLGRLKSLVILNCAYWRILRDLPESIGDLKSLEKLSLEQCNSLKKLPKSVGNLISLKSLNLCFCKEIDFLSSSLKNLKNLETLDLFGSNFKEIPSVVYDLKNLNFLRIENNPITKNYENTELIFRSDMFPLESHELISKKFKEGKLSESEAAKKLFSLIKNHKNSFIRAKSIEFFEKLGLNHRFLIGQLKQSLLYDKNPTVRRNALEYLVNHRFNENIKLLERIIFREYSAIVILTLDKLLNNINDEKANVLKNLLLKRIAELYHVNLKESKFFLDLLYLIDVAEEECIGKLTMDYLLTMDHLSIYAAKEGHVTALNLPHFNLRSLPESIGLLSKLEHLDIMGNKLKRLPISFDLLLNLKELVLSDNILIEVPDLVYKIAKQYYALKYIQQGVVLSEAPVLGLLEILKAHALIKFDIDEELPEYGGFCGYKINDSGNIIGIYIHEPGIVEIGFFPEQICHLRCLEELIFPSCEIRKIPKEIGKLSSLKSLNLEWNRITKIPLEIKKLKSLEYLNLKENKIKNIPKSLKPFLNSIEKFEFN